MGKEILWDVCFLEVMDGLRFFEGFIVLVDGLVILVEIVVGWLMKVFLDGLKYVVVEIGGGLNGVVMGLDGVVYICNNGGFEWFD